MTSSPRRPRRIRAGLAAFVTGSILTSVLLVGCTQLGATAQSSTSTTATATPSVAPSEPNDSPCTLLDSATLESLIDSAPSGSEVTVPGSDLPACQFGDITELGVQVARVPAGEWAGSLPAIVDGLRALPEGTLDPAVMKQLEDSSEAIAAGAVTPAGEACGYFSSLLELQGQEPGTTRSVSYYPDMETAIAVTGQQCVDGIYTSVVVGKDDLADDTAIVDQVLTVLLQIG
ncbi:hypothetical protein [Microbacterium sp. NPDC058389]|uniref:hypothetical protein n=1 Tax=Microbacterium sp. NPDC058389 TaxID=3346475 RepID=UPI00364E08A4